MMIFAVIIHTIHGDVLSFDFSHISLLSKML